MAQKFKLLFFLSLVVACLVVPDNPVAAETTDAQPSKTDPPRTNPPGSTQPSVTSDLVVSTKPSVTVDPSVSAKPPVTADPSVSTKPPVTADPSVSSKPPVTADPSVSSKPPVTADPSVSTKPPVTADPSVSTKPPVTADPSVSSKPPVTADPSVSTKPPVTADPSVSTKPPVTADPSVSTKPPVTADPSVSTKPSVTADPSVSAKPTSPEVTDAATSTPSLTTPEQDSCDPNPCGPGSTCEARAYPDYVCLCQTGDFYNNVSNSCQAGKVFPGNLVVPDIPYKEEMKNPKSAEFLEAAKDITNELDEVFKDDKDYTGSTVLKLEPIAITRVWSRKDDTPVKATVEISFTVTADVTTEGVLSVIKEYAKNCSNCLLQGANFTNENLCNKKPCDEETTKCSSTDGSFNCPCVNSYVSTEFSDRLCIACPSGKRAEGNECIDCSFGRSGLNCSESWQLTLVIVASVLGALLLITLLILPVVALKSSKKKSPKKNKNADVREPYASPIPAKAPLVNDSFANSQAPSANRSDNAFANAGVPRIPRATTTSSWDRDNLEMTPSNSRQNLVPGGRNARLYEDDDDMAPYSQSRPQSSLYGQARPQSSLYAQAGPQSSLYGQARPQSGLYAQARPQGNPYAQNQPQGNPYAQNQPQGNPYASNQGHANPYYMQDDGRRFN